MTPLKEWYTAKAGYTFLEKTWYSSAHLGHDHIVPSNTPIYAWSDMTVRKVVGVQMGVTAHCTDSYGKRVRIGHCNEVYGGKKVKGDLIGLSGNTGSLTTGAHTHTDVSYEPFDLYNINNFIDPLIYFKNPMRVKIIALNYPIEWIDVQPVREYFPIRLDFDVEYRTVDSIPWVKKTSSRTTAGTIWGAWWDGQFYDPNYDIICVVMDSVLWEGEEYGNILGSAVSYKIGGERVRRIDMQADINGKRDNQGWADNSELCGRLRHELMHIFYDMSNKGGTEDKVHYWDYERKDLKGAFTDITWDTFEAKELFDRTGYIGKLVKNVGSPKVYYVGKTKTAWIENEEKHALGVEEGWWGGFETVTIVDSPIQEDIIF